MRRAQITEASGTEQERRSDVMKKRSVAFA